MKRIATELGTRTLVLIGLLCLFTLFYFIGCFAVARTALAGDYVG